MRARGYSLVELAMAMAIASIVAAAAIGTFSVINRSVVQLRTEASVETKLQRVLSNLVADAQEVGGGPIRPWHAVYVQPGDAGSGFSDRMLLLTADPESDPCTVLSYNEATNALVVELENRDGDITTGPGGREYCCLHPSSPIDWDENAEPAYAGRFAVLTRGEDSVVVGITTLGAAASCDAIAEEFLTPERSAAFASFASGGLTVVDAKWVGVDHATHELKAWLLSCWEHIADADEGDTPGSTLAVSSVESETRILARDIFDLQLAIGYDLNLDGVVSETVGGAADEWLGNASGETAGEAWIGDHLDESATAGFLRERVRSIEFGLIVGLPTKNDAQRAGATVLDSPSRAPSRTFLRAGKARAVFRNSGIYE